MLTKTIILLLMLIIVFALGSGLFFLVRDAGKTKRPVQALSWRIGLSFALFLFLLFAAFMGWFKPHAL